MTDEELTEMERLCAPGLEPAAPLFAHVVRPKLPALLAEVRRLRGEREAVVAWLRAEGKLYSADAIAAGAHRKERP